MEDNRPIISQNSDGSDFPLPNLAPRHQELIPTPFGPIKPWAELTWPIKTYFILAILSLLCVLGLTISNLVKQNNEDFTVSLIQLIGILFCIYYVTRGILQENRQELIVFILSILLEMIRAIVNFSVLPKEAKVEIQPRFIVIMLVGLFHVMCSLSLVLGQNMMAFRVGGALESLQLQYVMLSLCFSLLTFDLQAQLCLSVLISFSGLFKISTVHSIILGIGIFWACLKVSIGIIAILKELKPLVWIFLLQNIPEIAYLVYLIYTVVTEWAQPFTLEAAAVTGSCISVLIKSILFWSLFRVYRSFGQGLRERMFSSYGRIDS
ncbi:uncharacterized protein LOC108696549 [Xenopus laevis]|uniref:Uncharacterized protein LOC108696549 n=2 Tax=Xenopus laevis TaxID=8355 RepID=A0A1L8FM14_XENLA|nr:uncharacterized protein LOC108696549 [Xenopus laevis]OCT72643.1 hypothetical protein XELAEV_18035625mg [Xenopus laevis]